MIYHFDLSTMRVLEQCSSMLMTTSRCFLGILQNHVLKMYKREKDKLKIVLGSLPGRICLTSDLWTSISTDGYVSLTAHYVDLNWKLQKFFLNFCLMPPPHTGIALSEKIYTFFY